MEAKKRVLTLLGIWAVGEGAVLALLPRRYLGFWAGAVSGLMQRVRPKMMENPQIPRLLGIAELSLGTTWLVMRRLSR